MFKRKDSGLWWMSIRHNGRRIQKSLGTADKRLAKAIEAKVRVEIIEGSYFQKPIGNNKTLKEMMEKFMMEHSPTVSENMQKSYENSLKSLMLFFGNANLMSISPKMISRYKMSRKGDGVKPATVNRALSMLSVAFNVAIKEWEWLSDNPVSKVSKEKERNKRDRWLSEDEERRLIENSPEWLSEIIVFSLNTGLRQGELISLEWSRVNVFRKTILITEAKNGEQRTVPLNKNALDVVVKKSKVRNLENDYVFLNRDGGKINPISLGYSFRKSLEKTKITDFRFHDLRHCFATRMAQRGIDIYKISKLLGHMDIKMTQRYAHHSPESLRIGVEALESDYDMTTVKENVM
ncbi:MAG: tyrosine-type recombinase/integrase [Candidatus Scalindua sp.]|nr:tyrosine-type recombinase/integrase [Candidatus Scalindua sp.]